MRLKTASFSLVSLGNGNVHSVLIVRTGFRTFLVTTRNRSGLNMCHYELRMPLFRRNFTWQELAE